MKSIVGVLVILVVAAALGPRSVGGHGAVVRLGASAVQTGDSLDVSGEGLGSADSIALVMEGAGGTFALATVVGDIHGRFSTRIQVPAEASPGEYRIVARAGDDNANATLLVTAGQPAIDVAPHGAMEARADLVEVERRRAPVEMVLAGALVVALIGIGTALIRTGRTE